MLCDERISLKRLLIIVILILLAACGSQERTPTSTPTSTQTPAPTPTPTLTPTLTPTPVPTPRGQTGQWQLVFSDEFNDQTLDTSKWATCWSYGCATTDPSVWYTDDNVLLGNGFVRLKAENLPQHEEGRTIPYTSGMLATGGDYPGAPPRFAIKYGYFEIRARVPSGKGLWPAFWMLTLSQKAPEIDVMEVLGKDPTDVHLHYHYFDDSGEEQDFGVPWSAGDFSTSWHTFAVDWRPDAIIWYVDGIERNRFEGKYVAAEPLYLILNLQVGSNDSWSGPADATTHFPAYFDIDYVRVWQRSKP